MDQNERTKQLIVNWLRAIVVTVLILALAVTFTLYFKPLYYRAIDRYNISEETGVDEAEIRSNYDALISYNTLFYDGELEFPTLPMSESGRIHFAEVKDIFMGLQWAGIVCLILLTPILTQARHKKDYSWLKYAGWLCIGLPVVAGILMLTCWDQLFVWFHRLFFRNDYWIFDPTTDPIIQFLPDEFFRDCGILIAALILIAAVVCLFLSKYVPMRIKNGAKTAKSAQKK